jgi:hypothetical protein
MVAKAKVTMPSSHCIARSEVTFKVSNSLGPRFQLTRAEAASGLEFRERYLPLGH